MTGVTARDILDRLHTKYAPPEWAAFDELRNAAGASARRTIDFFAVNTWPSKGLTTVAVEVKVSKTDFRRELDSPEKRGAITKFVNEFWFAAPKGVIPIEEVPDGCGLYETWGDKLRATCRARQFMDREPNRSLWTVIARRCAQDREMHDRQIAEFADLQGRAVSIEDLRRLAVKLIQSFEVRRRIRNEVVDEFQMSQAAQRGKSLLGGAWAQVVKDLRAIVRRELDLAWDEKPSAEQARTWLRAISSGRDLKALARQMRAFADDLDPPSDEERAAS